MKPILSILFLFLFAACSKAQDTIPARPSYDMYFKPSTTTLPDFSESQLIMNGATADLWYRIDTYNNGALGGSYNANADSTIYYTTATNALLDNWGTATAINIHGFFPTVFKYGSTYYMFIKQSGAAAVNFTTGDIYLYTSTNKTTWTVANSGNPVITHSATTTDWYNRLYNVGVAMVGSKMHILVEGKAASGTYSTNAQLGYAVADIATPTFTLQATPQIANGYNPELLYVPERNALVVAYNNIISGKSYGLWAKASLDATLTNASSWQLSPIYNTSLSDTSLAAYPSDFSIAFTPGKTYPAMITYCWSQSYGHQAYMPQIHSPLELFKAIGSPVVTGGSTATTPGGATGNVQFNNAGAFGGSSNLFWDNTNARLGIGTTPGNDLDITKSVNSFVGITVKNTNGGSGAYATFSIQSNSAAVGFNVLPSTWASSGIYKASGGSLDGSMSGGFSIANTNASGVLRFYTGGSTDANERMRIASGGQVGINNSSPATSAQLDVSSTTRGMLPPRMTTTQRDAISSPATGLTLFCTDCTATDASTGVMQTYNGSSWKNYW